MIVYVLERAYNDVGEGENARQPTFSLFLNNVFKSFVHVC